MADMNDPAQECAGRQNHCPSAYFRRVAQTNATHAPAFHQKVGNLAINDGQVRMSQDLILNCAFVKRAVCLGPRALYRRALPPVQQPKLNPRPIRCPPHNAIERVNLANKVPFSESTNRGIAGHHPDFRRIKRNQNRAHTHPRSGMRRINASMSATNDDNFKIRMFHVKHLLPEAEARENIIEHRLYIDLSKN